MRWLSLAAHFSSAALVPRIAPLMNIASAIPCGLLRTNYRMTALAPAVNYFGQLTGQREHGGRGRIRTSVARKERQIYSLLVLATHPPVLEKNPSETPTALSSKTNPQT
jgi:hypothetical protein